MRESCIRQYDLPDHSPKKPFPLNVRPIRAVIFEPLGTLFEDQEIAIEEKGLPNGSQEKPSSRVSTHRTCPDLVPRKSAHHVLKTLYRSGYQLYILTLMDNNTVKSILQKLNWNVYFKDVLSVKTKHQTFDFEIIQKNTHLRAQQILFVSNNLVRGYRPAKAMGCAAVIFRPKSDFKDGIPEIHKLEDLIALLAPFSTHKPLFLSFENENLVANLREVPERHFYLSHKNPININKILEVCTEKYSLGKPRIEELLIKNWEFIMTAKYAHRTRPIKITQNGTHLSVHVPNATLRSEIQFLQNQIIANIQKITQKNSIRSISLSL